MSGEVIHGNHLGRRLGFPTANIDPDRIHVALMGIFAVRVTGLGEDVLEGVASVGTRPTVGGTKMLLEVYIFDFDEDIYGRELQVEFVEKIREELNFPDIDALIENINNDVAIARTILAPLIQEHQLRCLFHLQQVCQRVLSGGAGSISRWSVCCFSR